MSSKLPFLVQMNSVPDLDWYFGHQFGQQVNVCATDHWSKNLQRTTTIHELFVVET